MTRVTITRQGKSLIDTIKQERSNRATYVALETMNESEVDSLLLNLARLYNNLNKGGD